MRRLRIATRRSPLALWQARHVAAQLKERHDVESELLELTTEGDRFLAAPLSAAGGKGLFVKEIEAAVLAGDADLAVHSLKDMTTAMPDGLLLACTPRREDPRDAFVGRQAGSLWSLPRGARVGTSSLRRSCQIAARRPDLVLVPLRGNVQTRLAKLDEGDELGGVVLALAGLRRLGLESRVSEAISTDDCVPAVGQGVLAIQCREADLELREWLLALEDEATRAAITAERALLEQLEGGCTVPLAAYARADGGRLRLTGLVGRTDGTQILRAERMGSVDEARDLGRRVADQLLASGARGILAAYGRR